MARRVTGKKRRLGIFIGVVLSALILAKAALWGGEQLYQKPRIDELTHADAIFVIGGPGWQRFPYAIDLARKGYAPNLVISTAIGPRDPGLWQFCQKKQEKFVLHCFIPDPPTTRGEAEELRRLATAYGWRKVIVVTFRPHISRARFILERCFSGDLIMVESPSELTRSDWAYEYAYQTAGFIRALLSPGC